MCLAAGAQVDLGRVAEPAGDVLGLGQHRPDDVDRGLDQDLSLDAIRNHVSSFGNTQPTVARYLL